MTPFVSLTAAITTCLLFLSLHPSLSLHQSRFDVVDIQGSLVRNYGSYIIIPEGHGGHLALTQKAGEPPCPNYITRKPTSHGIPTTMFILPRLYYISTSFPVFFTFHTNFTTCEEPLGWHVTTDKTSGQLYVVSGGTPPITTPGYFTIEEAKSYGKKNTYKIRWCSSADGDGKCGFVGFLRDRLMGITNENPLFVRFMEVNANSGFFEI